MNTQLKQKVAKTVASYLKDNQTIGIGTGSTVEACIIEIGKKIKEDAIKISALVTSLSSALLCVQNGITVLNPLSFKEDLDWGFDGADEIDSNGRVIKGQGAAMLLEKIIAKRCREFYIVADETKVVGRLGERFPVPVEVIPEALFYVEKKLLAVNGVDEVVVRISGKGKYGPVVTDKGNLILDVKFSRVDQEAESDVKKIVGVVETGLFDGIVNRALIASEDGVEIKKFSY